MSRNTMDSTSTRWSIYGDQPPEAGHTVTASNCTFLDDPNQGDPDVLCRACRAIEQRWFL
ncbi:MULTISPECIES: hypothetical protein [Mycolicibacter]|uniref:hypothetical protein n=1 Tax=Mycolicibacter TaxID=1073531 RepID=UPI000DD91AB1|nr:MULTISPECIES: hypothetical protein [Mycolicibacter]